MKKTFSSLMLSAGAGLLLFSAQASATYVKVQVDNLFDDGGLALTPVWLGFHDGSFDAFNAGEASSSALQALAENGDTSAISADFMAETMNGVDLTLVAPGGAAPVFEPGESHSSDPIKINAADNGFFSFLSMLIPTNDAFIGNDSGSAYALFNSDGDFVGLDILILGAQVWDSGTEQNIGYGSPFLVGADGMPRQDEGGVVALHTGLDVGPGGFAIIGGTTPTGYTIEEAAADFTQAGFEVARIRVTQVPEPATAGLALLGLGGLLGLRRRKLKS